MEARVELQPAGRTLSRTLDVAFGNLAIPMVPSPDAVESGRQFTIDAVRERWQAGQCALHALADHLDTTGLSERAAAICAALDSEDAPNAERLHSVFSSRPDLTVEWAKRSIDPTRGGLEEAIGQSRPDLDPRQVDSILRLTILPGLVIWSDQICAEVYDGLWPHGLCPICGSGPAFAESRGLEQGRHARCDRCASSWPLLHLLCPYCGNTDHRTLRYVYIERDRERAKLSICECCGGKLKVISTIAPLSPPAIFVAELELVDLDWVNETDG